MHPGLFRFTCLPVDAHPQRVTESSGTENEVETATVRLDASRCDTPIQDRVCEGIEGLNAVGSPARLCDVWPDWLQ